MAAAASEQVCPCLDAGTEGRRGRPRRVEEAARPVPLPAGPRRAARAAAPAEGRCLWRGRSGGGAIFAAVAEAGLVPETSGAAGVRGRGGPPGSPWLPAACTNRGGEKRCLDGVSDSCPALSGKDGLCLAGTAASAGERQPEPAVGAGGVTARSCAVQPADADSLKRKILSVFEIKCSSISARECNCLA